MDHKQMQYDNYYASTNTLEDILIKDDVRKN